MSLQHWHGIYEAALCQAKAQRKFRARYLTRYKAGIRARKQECDQEECYPNNHRRLYEIEEMIQLPATSTFITSIPKSRVVHAHLRQKVYHVGILRTGLDSMAVNSTMTRSDPPSSWLTIQKVKKCGEND